MHRAAPANAPLVGGYRLAGLIGSGAIGAVHLAVDPASGQQVALKILPLAGSNAAEREQSHRRFMAEADAARRLVHPDIVRVLAAGEDAGNAWLAMELLAGCDLVRYTRAARLLPEVVAVGVAERLAHALAHAHGAGVIHRDLKPANVMVDWASDRVTLTDFGLARLAGAERTQTGLVLGTPAYMAPEQLAGAAASASGDLYSLGVLLFQLLIGSLPHESPSLGELLRRVATEPAPDLRQLRPDLPSGLADLLAGLLAKRPDERPPDAGAAAAALKSLHRELGATTAGPKSRV